MINATTLLADLPAGLRDELIAEYQSIVTNYLERRWKPSELGGGTFAEVAFCIVEGALKGSFPDRASKPANMFQACLDLEKRYPPNATRVGDRSLRIMIPRLLPVLYEVRNNRSVGHVGGDVDANHMDAEAVLGMASWVMAEFVRIFHGVTTREAEDSVDALVERRTPLIWDVDGVRRVLDPETSARDQVLLLLHHSSGWVDATDLFKWTEYSNASMFRSSVLKPLHKARLIEHDEVGRKARLSPTGAADVEKRLLHGRLPQAKP